MKTRRLFSILPALLAPVVLFLGCSVSPEKSPAYIKLTKRIQALEEQKKKDKNSIEGLYCDIDTMEQDVKAVRKSLQTVAAAPGQTGKQIAAALQRVAAVEKRLKTMTNGADAQKKNLVAALAQQKKNTDTLTALKKQTGKRTTVSASARRAKPKSLSSAVRSAKASTARGRAAASAKPRGFYYSVRNGDTMHNLASRYKVSSVTICRANRMPLTAQLYAGQSIYIPAM